MNSASIPRKTARLLCHRSHPFDDNETFSINESALRTYVQFLINNGLESDTATFLAGGAAGDFSTMTFNERIRVAEIVADEVNGRVPLAFGAQSTSTLELVKLAQAAQSMQLDFIQVSCPFYFTHTEADFEEFVRAAAKSCARCWHHHLQHVLDLIRGIVLDGRKTQRARQHCWS